jgi:hypothetical protein
MAHRSAKFASTVLAVAVAGTIFSALPRGVANAAECVSEPKDQTPQRKHWYYRIERGTGRHCWYLREESERSLPAASTNSPALEKADSRKAESTAPHSIADARAELTLPQTQIDYESPASATPSAQPIWPKLAAAGNDQHVKAGDVFTQQSSISSRWPESSGEKPPARPQPAELVADAGPDPVPTPLPRAAAPVGPGRADVQPGRASGSVQMLLLVILGALALAGLTGSIVFRLGGRPRSNSIRGSRRVVWESTERPVLELEDDMPTQWADTDQPPPEYTRGGALQPNDSDERIDMITEFLERMSKQVRADADAISAADSATRGQNSTGQPAVRVLVAPREEPI